MPKVTSRDPLSALQEIREQLPNGQPRPGQDKMLLAVQESISEDKPAIIQAGTGVGKSLAYLIPAILSGKKVVVVTASIALQDQLSKKDLPFLREHLAIPFSWAVMKGRGNYWCLQKEDEHNDKESPLFDAGDIDTEQQAQIDLLTEWAHTTDTGDRADAPIEPDYKVWSMFSSSSVECPGANKCKRSQDCWAERSRSDAHFAQVLVVNTHLWSANVAAITNPNQYGEILPEHDVVIIDEAHEMPDILSAALGKDLHYSKMMNAAKSVGRVLHQSDAETGLQKAGGILRGALEKAPKGRIQEQDWQSSDMREVLKALNRCESAVINAMNAVDGVSSANHSLIARKMRAIKELRDIQSTIALFIDQRRSDYVFWIDNGKLCNRPIFVSSVLKDIWADGPTPIMCSATIHPQFAGQVGLSALGDGEGGTPIMRVPSPFNFKRQGILYVPETLGPPPKGKDPQSVQEKYDRDINKHIETLVQMSNGRALVLCTSFRRMESAYEHLVASSKVEHHVYKQGDLPKPALIEAYKEDVHSILVATRSFWTGVDIPGDALSMLIIDKLPFPTPDDPVIQARKERINSPKAFELVDIPQTAITLAQGVGRLIRSEKDKGVIAVMDTRLATARYRNLLLDGLPPFRRVRNLDVVLGFLRDMGSTTEDEG